LDAVDVGGEEALLFVGELRVERLSGNAGAVDHIGDPDIREPELRDGRDDRAQQTAALCAGDRVRVQRAAAAGEATLGVDVGERAHGSQVYFVVLMYATVLVYYHVSLKEGRSMRAVGSTQSLDAVARAGGPFRGVDRWLVPQRFIRWTDSTPERYMIDLPLAPKVLLTCSPEDCRIIFTERSGALLFGEGLRRLAPHEPMFGRDALDALDGDEHTRFRRQLTAAFHGEALKGYERGIVAVTERHIARWPVNEPVRFSELTQDLARDVIAETVFGVTEPARARRLQSALDRLDGMLNSIELAARFAAAVLMRGRWAPYRAMESVHADIAAVTREEITARRAAPGVEHHDCLDRFLKLDPTATDAVSDDEIVAAMRVLVIAGWATTANTLAWIAERLVRHPAALASCEHDVRENGGGRYLVATVQETLRMRPPVPVTVRYVARDFQLGDLLVPRGTLIATDIERMHYRPDIYPQPRQFRPERFIETRPGTYTWIPFGGGVHRCIGAGFALTEARLILHTLLRHRTLAPDRSRGEPSRRTTLITAPARGVTITLQPASAQHPARNRA
jgi:cytochrome P450